MKIKICGINSLENALEVARCGVDFIGLNFYEPSPRAISISLASEICEKVRSELGDQSPAFIGVFVNMDLQSLQEIVEAAQLDGIQLSGDEPLDFFQKVGEKAIKAIRPQDEVEAMRLAQDFQSNGSPKLPSLLVDAYHPNLYGGTGAQTSLEIGFKVREKSARLMLAGGLKPDNILERAGKIQPWGLDIASGAESGTAGLKDLQKVNAIITVVKELERLGR